MTLRELPYVGQLCLFFLLAQEEVTAVFDQRILIDLEADQTFPAVRISELAGKISQPYWLTSPIVQFECFANDRVTARRGASLCHATLAQRLVGVASYGGVTATITDADLGGITDLSDSTFVPARPYARFDAVITAHP